MGVVLLRPPAAADEHEDVSYPPIAGERPAPRMLGGVHSFPLTPRVTVRARQRWQPRWEHRVRATILSLFFLSHVFRQRPATLSSWRSLLAALSALDVSTATRFVPHGLVLILVVVAAASGGFSRPDNSMSMLMNLGSDEGSVSAHGRFVLGPRVAELQQRDALVRPALPTTSLAPSRPRADAVTYKVQPGDTIWDIGARFNVGSYSVLWSNGLDEDAIIKPGQELRIPPVVGVLHNVAGQD
ncbi:MAG TPA: LysM peptidoglycan-binding domain-containing protein, partial [Chloroflexota bacterium]|nr:LysM peptidoglycan-binding domain-containing protein [Chloroflexota bacterium]